MGKISTPKNRPRRRRCASALFHYFPLGSRIEVETMEDDLFGVYFSATVVPPPSSGSKNSRQLYVEYDNLLASEDGPDRLSEGVNISLVRPEPPLQEVAAHGFVINDVVDAFYKDGWWTGVVNRVVEGGQRFAVAFEKPPDEHEFGLSELRVHWDWDWVDGVWSWPHKLPSDKGMKVEVSLSEFEGVWFPAEIVQPLENGAFLVKFSSEDGALVTREVDCLHVRPSPPAIKIAEFRESEKVEALFNFGWWSGVVTKAVEKTGYIVLFDKTTDQLNNNVFDLSKLRPFMHWKDGKWFIVSDAMDDTPLSSMFNSIRSCTAKKKRSLGGASVGSMKKKKKEDEVTTTEKKLEIENADGEVGQTEEMGAMKKKHNGETEDADQEHAVTATEKIILEVDNAVGRIEEKGDNQENEVTTTEKIIVEVENAAGEEGRIEEMGAMTKKHSGEIEDADQENEVTTTEKIILGVENAVGRIEEKGANQENEVTTTEKIISEVENAGGEVGRIEEMGAMEMDTDQEHAVGRIEEVTHIPPSIPPNELPCSVGIELTNMPFVKSNAVWKAFESMEIFRKLPQKPHFEPLKQFKESLREGLAIGCMVNFTNTIDRCCSLKIDDPKCVFDDMKEVLMDLEGHGFDVGVVQRGVINLLEMKEREEKLVQEVKVFNNHLLEHGEKKSRINREICVINEHLRRLREQLSIEETAEATVVDEIARLEAGLKEVDEQIKSVRCDFEGVLLPLRLL